LACECNVPRASFRYDASVFVARLKTLRLRNGDDINFATLPDKLSRDLF
jgi:hypothetical protein